MYRRPKFLEVLIEIRQEMAREADYDVDLFAEIVRTGKKPQSVARYPITEPRSGPIERKVSRTATPKKAKPL